MTRREKILVDALKDLAERGTMHDLNPTRMELPATPEGRREAAYYTDYMRGMDKAVRRVALDALRRAARA